MPKCKARNPKWKRRDGDLVAGFGGGWGGGCLVAFA